MMNFSGDDIRLDEKAVSSRISQCCSVAGMRVEGVAAINDILTVICSDNDPAADMEYIYRLSPLTGDSREDMFAELRCRYDYGFRTAGAFQLADGIWLLTEKNKDF